MTERYQMIHLGNLYDYVIKDHIGNKTYDMIHNKEHKKEIVNVLNSLSDENEQLKQQIQSINKDLTQIMLILLDDDISQKLTETELKAFERLSKFKGDV